MIWRNIFWWERICRFFTLCSSQRGKTRDSLSPKIFRQITCLLISLVKMLLSRNFCQKRMRENFRNFHTVQCGFKILLPPFRHKNSAKSTFSLKSQLSIDLTEKISLFPHCSTHSVEKLETLSLSSKFFRAISSLVTSLVKILLIRTFCQNEWE